MTQDSAWPSDQVLLAGLNGTQDQALSSRTSRSLTIFTLTRQPVVAL